jgi:hypothetical protein
MRKALRLMIGSVAGALAFAPLARASTPSVAASGPPQQSSGIATAGPFLTAIQSADTSIIIAQPKCGDGTTLTGAFVMETPQRAGFPLDATTFASPQGIFTSVTTTGDESEAVIAEIASILSSRADNFVKRLLRNCSL